MLGLCDRPCASSVDPLFWRTFHRCKRGTWKAFRLGGLFCGWISMKRWGIFFHMFCMNICARNGTSSALLTNARSWKTGCPGIWDTYEASHQCASTDGHLSGLFCRSLLHMFRIYNLSFRSGSCCALLDELLWIGLYHRLRIYILLTCRALSRDDSIRSCSPIPCCRCHTPTLFSVSLWHLLHRSQRPFHSAFSWPLPLVSWLLPLVSCLNLLVSWLNLLVSWLQLFFSWLYHLLSCKIC